MAPAPRTIIVNDSTSCNTIGPEGGSVAHAGRAQLVVPAGALASPTSLCLTGVMPPNDGALGGRALGQAFRAAPAGQTFRKPVAVVLPFEATAIPPGARTDQVQIQMAPHGTQDFTPIASNVDLSTGLVRAETVHFTDFVPAINPNPVFITTVSELPAGTVGLGYTHDLVAIGGAPPYAWSVSSLSVLPPGLGLGTNGTLSGAPSLPSQFAFFITATDTANRSVQAAFGIAVLPASNPVPTLASVTPSSAEQGNATIIALTGMGFVPNSEVRWDGASIATTFVSTTALSASIPATNLQTPGQHQLTVFNPTPRGGLSGSVVFAVTPAIQNPVPTIASVSPTLIPVSNVDTNIRITGTNFIATSSAAIGSQGISTSYVSATELLATIPATYLAAPGTLQIAVHNPPPGGGFSASSRPVTVGSLNPVPSIATITPQVVTAGSSEFFTLTATGSGFVSAGQMFFGTTALATTVNSPTTASALVPAHLVAAAGPFSISFVNPPPGGGASTSITFTVALTDAGPDVMDAGASIDAGDAASFDAGQPCADPSLGQGSVLLTEPKQVTIWHEYDYLLHSDPSGSTSITSCNGNSGVYLGSSGISTATLMPGWYSQTIVQYEPQPPFWPTATTYYSPTIVYEPVPPQPPEGCTPLTSGGGVQERFVYASSRCFTITLVETSDISVSYQLVEPMRGGVSLGVSGAETVTPDCYRDGNPLAGGRSGCIVGATRVPPGTYGINVYADLGTSFSLGVTF